MKIGILGGTFDPIHLGHLRAAEEIGEKMRLDKVYLIPSALPPHKSGKPVTSFYHRLAIARLAIGNSSILEVLDLEGKRDGLSYSIETLKELHSMFRPGDDFFFILGMDAFLEITTWKEYQNLFNYAHFVIIRRPGFQTEKIGVLLSGLGTKVEQTDLADVFLMPSGKRLMIKETTLMDISSTGIRKMLSQGKSIRFLVPEPVRDYILKKGLYRSYAADHL